MVVLPYGQTFGGMFPPVIRFDPKKTDGDERERRVLAEMNNIVATYGGSINPESLLAEV